MYFSFFRNKIPSLGLCALFVLFFISGCRAGLINIQSPATPGSSGAAISSTKENLAAAGGVAGLLGSNVKIKFTMGYVNTGSVSTLPTVNLRSTSAGVINEE